MRLKKSLGWRARLPRTHGPIWEETLEEVLKIGS